MEREVSILEQRKVAAAMEEKQLLDKLWETYELSHEAAKQHRVEIESVPKASRRIGGAEAGHLQPGLHKFGGHRGVSAGQ